MALDHVRYPTSCERTRVYRLRVRNCSRRHAEPAGHCRVHEFDCYLEGLETVSAHPVSTGYLRAARLTGHLDATPPPQTRPRQVRDAGGVENRQVPPIRRVHQHVEAPGRTRNVASIESKTSAGSRERDTGIIARTHRSAISTSISRRLRLPRLSMSCSSWRTWTDGDRVNKARERCDRSARRASAQASQGMPRWALRASRTQTPSTSLCATQTATSNQAFSHIRYWIQAGLSLLCVGTGW